MYKIEYHFIDDSILVDPSMDPLTVSKRMVRLLGVGEHVICVNFGYPVSVIQNSQTQAFIEWCIESFDYRVSKYFRDERFWLRFKSQDDAMMFKLVFG